MWKECWCAHRRERNRCHTVSYWDSREVNHVRSGSWNPHSEIAGGSQLYQGWTGGKASYLSKISVWDWVRAKRLFGKNAKSYGKGVFRQLRLHYVWRKAKEKEQKWHFLHIGKNGAEAGKPDAAYYQAPVWPVLVLVRSYKQEKAHRLFGTARYVSLLSGSENPYRNRPVRNPPERYRDWPAFWVSACGTWTNGIAPLESYRISLANQKRVSHA